MTNSYLRAIAFSGMLGGFVGFLYVAGCAWMHPETLERPFTHLTMWLREDVFGILAFLVMIASAFVWHLTEKKLNKREQGVIGGIVLLIIICAGISPKPSAVEAVPPSYFVWHHIGETIYGSYSFLRTYEYYESWGPSSEFTWHVGQSFLYRSCRSNTHSVTLTAIQDTTFIYLVNCGDRLYFHVSTEKGTLFYVWAYDYQKDITWEVVEVTSGYVKIRRMNP